MRNGGWGKPDRGPSCLLRQPLARRRPASSWNGLTLAVPSAGSGSMAEPKSWDSRERQPEPSDINEIAAFCNRNCKRRIGDCAIAKLLARPTSTVAGEHSLALGAPTSI